MGKKSEFKEVWIFSDEKGTWRATIRDCEEEKLKVTQKHLESDFIQEGIDIQSWKWEKGCELDIDGRLVTVLLRKVDGG